MGTTIHSSFDFGSELAWLENPERPSRPAEGLGQRQVRLNGPAGAMQEFLRWTPVPAGGSRKLLEAMWKSAAEQVAFAVRVVQAPPAAQTMPEDVVSALSQNLNTLKEALAEAFAGIQKADEFPHLKLREGAQPLPRPFVLACALLQAGTSTFEEKTATKFLTAAQERTSLEMSELWHLKPLLELALLGEFAREMKEIASFSGRVDSGGAQGIQESLSRLRPLLDTLTEVAGTEWKLFFESICLTEKILRGDPQG